MDNVVTFFDVDNTLLDNDAIVRDLNDHLERQFGPASRDRYWAIFEALRSELGYADYLGALQRYRSEAPNDTRLLLMSGYLMDYPFAGRLYPGALGAIERAASAGTDRDSVRRRRRVSAAQGAALRTVGSGARPSAHLYPQGADAGADQPALSGQALRHGRRQAAYTQRDEAAVGPRA
jgi:hypothetical protein